MKKVLLSLAGLSEENKKILQDLKIFLAQNAEWSFVLVASKKSATSLNGKESIEIVPVDEKAFSDEAERLDYEFQILLEEERGIDFFLPFGKREMILAKAKAFLKDVATPVAVRMISSPKTGRRYVAPSFLDDVPLTPQRWDELLETALKFAASLKDEPPRFSLLSPYRKEEGDLYAKADELFSQREGYDGLRPMSDIMNAKSDILLFDPKEYEVFEGGLKEGAALLKNYIQVTSSDASFKYKLANFFLSGIFDNYDEYYRRNTRKDLEFLLGYDKKIVLSPSERKIEDLTETLEILARIFTR